MRDQRGRAAWIGSTLTLALIAGGCTGTTPPDGAAASVSPTVLTPLLPSATSPADISEDQELAAALDAEFAADEYSGLVSVIVLADGRTAYERYLDSEATDHHHVWSVTKSIISTLVGIAIGEGKIPGLDATLAELLPDHAESMTPVVAGITLEQLLTMTSGISDGAPRQDDVVASILRMQFWEPGAEFHYTNNNAHLVAAILVEATGMPLLEYARAMLFDPLGIPTVPADQPTFTDVGDLPSPSGFGWLVDAQGVNTGGLGLWLRAQDMAKIGLLHLNDGTWEGKQILPTDWVKTATTEHVPLGAGLGDFAAFGEVGYGYFWWTSHLDARPIHWANGSGGQRIILVPDRDLVAVTQARFSPTSGATGPTDTAVNDAFTSLIAPASASIHRGGG